MQPRLGLRTLVVVDFVSSVPAVYRRGSRLVQTPLDFVLALEEAAFERVVLIGTFARERCFAKFAREASPNSDMIMIYERNDRTAAVMPVFV